MVAIRNCKFLLAVTGWADSEGNERRSCKIDVFGIGCQGKPSAGGGRPPLRLGCCLAGQSPKKTGGSLRRGNAPGVRRGYAGTAYHTEYKTSFSELFFRFYVVNCSILLSR